MRPLAFKVSSESDVKQTLDRSHQLCLQYGCSDVTTHEVTTIVSELAYNLVKYGRNGRMTLQIDPSANKLDINARDDGPGVREGAIVAMAEGFSSGGSLGLGMASLVRLSDRFIMESDDAGTRIHIVKALQ